MNITRLRQFAAISVAAVLLSACNAPPVETPPYDKFDGVSEKERTEREGLSSVFDVFSRDNKDTTVLVNRYIWSATLQVLDFLPVQSVDPFTGVIVTGYGTPPGGSRPYRATVLVNDPALDARSLNVALQTSNGRAVDAATTRAVEDAILSRARQLRIDDSKR